MALQCRPDIHAAQAPGRPGRRPRRTWPGPTASPARSSAPSTRWTRPGIQYIGFVYITPIPIWNNGGPLLRQREAEHRRAHLALEHARQRAVAQVRSALAKWNGASELIKETSGLTGELAREVKNAGASLRAGTDRPDPADAGPAAADPAPDVGGRRHLGRDPGPGRPAAGDRGPGPDPGDAQPGRGRRRPRRGPCPSSRTKFPVSPASAPSPFGSPASTGVTGP